MDILAVLLGVILVAGVVLCLLGAVSVRRDEPGSTLFGASVVLWGALPLVDGAASVVGATGVSGFVWVVAVVPWLLFSLVYTGRAVTRRRVVLAAAPILAVVPWLWSVTTSGSVAVFEVVGILVFVYYAAVATVGAVLVVQATARYGHLSLRQGVWLALAGVIPAATMNAFGVLTEQVGETVLFAVYAAGLVSSTVVVALALFVDDVFDATPAAGTVGERAALRESDDAIVIIDADGRVVVHNEHPGALAAFEPDPTGQPIADALGYSVDALRGRETLTLQTDDGARQFDPQVTALTDQHDRRIGTIVSLRDVTDRQHRRQRLEVLNRILRHNLRNQTAVIKANTEVVAAELGDDQLRDHLETAMDSADSLTELGHKAKRIQTVIDESGERTAVGIADVLEAVAAESDQRWPAATVAVGECPAETVETDSEALRFALDNLVENAVEHGGTAPTVTLTASVDAADDPYPVTVTVADDGPGIPDREVDVLEAGTETPLKHGSGLGLWVTNWTVRELGGKLTFPERGPEGTTVAVRLPASP
jgi:signal transduction histidine kinase